MPQMLLRYGNAKGSIIPMHHAFKTLHLGSVSRMSAVVLPVFFSAFLWLFLPSIMNLWDHIFFFWMQNIYGSGVGYAPVNILGQDLSIPYPLLDADAPSEIFVHRNLAVCIVAFFITLLISKRLAPFTYFTRAILLIQASASIDRMVSADFFPYTLKGYIVDAMIECTYMLFLIPILLGAVYYIFDFAPWKKILLTLMILGYFFITIPCQYMLHAYIIHEGTLLFLPLMYMMFGTLIDVLMFISLYSFGMSWKSRNAAVEGRGAQKEHIENNR